MGRIELRSPFRFCGALYCADIMGGEQGLLRKYLMSMTQAASKFLFVCFFLRKPLSGSHRKARPECLGGRGDTIGEGNVFY